MARNKYNAKRCEEDGIKFDSLAERDYYRQLRLRSLGAKEISCIVCHPQFPITINEIQVCKVELDFQYLDHEAKKIIYVDVKGVYTAISRLKHKLFEAQYNEKVTIVRKIK